MMIALALLFILPLAAFAACLIFRVAPMAGSDWIPTQDAALDAFATNVDTKITAAPATYGLVAADAAAFNPIRVDYTNALVTSTAPATRTSVSIAAKDVARTNLKIALRDLAAKVHASTTVTDADKTALGLTVRDSAPTVISAPATFPLLSIISATPLAHDVRFADSLTPDSRSKPFDAVGMELHVQASAVPITDPTSIKYHSLATRNPIALEHSAADAGKIAYMAGRWINAKGQRGPWSSIATMTVAA
jgi:hypothetical protein